MKAAQTPALIINVAPASINSSVANLADSNPMLSAILILTLLEISLFLNGAASSSVAK